MRVSFEWLQEYVNIDIPVAVLAEKLTMSGIAVEEVEDQADKYKGIITAKILSLEKHSQADNLLVSKVDAGAYGIKQVITAARNLVVEDLIPLALPGTILPNGKTIEEANFKGVLSQGMMCSGAELGLEKESTGIWVFSKGSFKTGMPVAEALGATDYVLVLELTANRSDCLGMIGVARDVAAILGKPLNLKPVTLKEEGPSITQVAKVEIIDQDLCPRYAARVVSGVKIQPSPEWMQNRLKAAGIRPINNIVDITNYIMLEYNQPLHAFDLDRIKSQHIIVRRAKPGEKLVTLDDIERIFSRDELLIADPEGGLCVAGVMGGCTSEVTDKTVNLLLEAAYFNPLSIRKTARELGMKTEASLRFERGIDPNGVVTALNRAAQLIEELGAGKVALGYLDEYPQPVAPLSIRITTKQMNDWLGTNLTNSEIKEYLQRVDFVVTSIEEEAFKVTIPTYRRDVTHMADLAEEVARLYGYNNIPATLPESKQLGERTLFQKLQLQWRHLLQGIGLSEIMTYSLYSRSTAKELRMTESDPLFNTVDLMVPLSEEQAVMRTNLVHHLLETLAFNSKRRQLDVSVFEIARVYWPKKDSLLPEEPLHLGIGLMGRMNEVGWNQSRDEVDFYDLKGILELFIAKFNFAEFTLKHSLKPFLHPGQSADVFVNEKVVGFLGQVHPTIQNQYELTKKAFILELDLSALYSQWKPESISFHSLPKYPAVQRDLALVLSAEISAQNIIAKIKQMNGDLVEGVDLFDVYQGEQVGMGQRSLAFSITYRSKERTLSDAEVNQLQEELLKQLHQEFGAAVRI